MDRTEALAILSRLERSNPALLPQIEDLSFPEQDRFVKDPSRFISALCTRRAGKSNGLGLRYFRTMKSHPGCFCPYIALTRESAKNIMWDVLQEQDERFKIGAKFTPSDLTCTLKNGSRLQLFGADMKNFIRRLKGTKSPGVGIDESQDFGSHLRQLMDDVLTPTIIDYKDSWLALVGTPGPVPHGIFYEITGERKYNFSHHEWSILQNPYIEDAQGFIDKLKRDKGWTDDNPTLLREWYGKWVQDLDALVFRYDRAKNDYRSLPEVKGKWDYVIGVDLGHDDADAIAVVGWNEHIKEAYLIEEDVQTKQGITELARKIEVLIEKYDPVKVVMDTGGLGKKIAEEIRRRFSLPIEAADKARKFEFIELLNDSMRIGRFYAKATSQFALDCARVKRDANSVKLKIDDAFHSDICDAVLYAFREALHWLSDALVIAPTPGSPAWNKKQENIMEKYAEELTNRNNSLEEWPDFDWNE